jgi:hypothetical protein
MPGLLQQVAAYRLAWLPADENKFKAYFDDVLSENTEVGKCLRDMGLAADEYHKSLRTDLKSFVHPYADHWNSELSLFTLSGWGGEPPQVRHCFQTQKSQFILWERGNSLAMDWNAASDVVRQLKPHGGPQWRMPQAIEAFVIATDMLYNDGARPDVTSLWAVYRDEVNNKDMPGILSIDRTSKPRVIDFDVVKDDRGQKATLFIVLDSAH